jgi:hypothetical protein
LKELCQIQLRQYSIACETETSDRQKSKDADALLQEQMSDFQRGIGAKPPGAVGRKGGGRGEHSTNTRLGQPATFQFANSTTKTAVVAVEGVEVPTMPPAIQRVTNETSPAVSSITTTPANRSKTSQGGRSTPKNSGSVNSDAMERINAACVNFEKIADRLCLSSDQGNSKKITNKPTRLERLQLKLKALKDSADFYENKGPQYADKLRVVMDKYEKVHDKLMEELSGGDSDSE